jgi:uncharacterized membrane protein
MNTWWSVSAGGTMDDLGGLIASGGPSSSARSINRSGTVGGTRPPSDSLAWIRIPSQPNGTGGQPTDHVGLVPAGSGWLPADARGINGNGQILGTGPINGVRNVSLLNPQCEDAQGRAGDRDPGRFPLRARPPVAVSSSG